jgi:hypothetical protein
MKALAALALIIAATVPAAAQKVYVDYDREADFSKYRTFAWAETPPTSLEANHPMAHEFIKESIAIELTGGGGMIEDLDDPDVFVTYHTAPKESLQLMVAAFGYAYPSGWGWDPYWGTAMVTGSAQVNTYRKGSLIIDVWDARTKLALFRGTASDVISENPEKALRQVDKAITKIVQKYRKMRAQEP